MPALSRQKAPHLLFRLAEKLQRKTNPRQRSENNRNSEHSQLVRDAQASIPSGFSTSRLNACISFAPSAPSIARWVEASGRAHHGPDLQAVVDHVGPLLARADGHDHALAAD